MIEMDDDDSFICLLPLMTYIRMIRNKVTTIPGFTRILYRYFSLYYLSQNLTDERRQIRVGDSEIS